MIITLLVTILTKKYCCFTILIIVINISFTFVFYIFGGGWVGFTRELGSKVEEEKSALDIPRVVPSIIVYVLFFYTVKGRY
jgi:heme/copper-type cytochrome/quinol oxidase subunit 2